MLFHTKKNHSFAYLWFSNAATDPEVRRENPQRDTWRIHPGLCPSLSPELCRVRLGLQCNGKSNRKLNVHNSRDELCEVKWRKCSLDVEKQNAMPSFSEVFQVWTVSASRVCKWHLNAVQVPVQ